MTEVVYLGGLGRSGSTLVERVLGQLPGVCSLGEVVHLWHRGLLWNEACGCGAPFAECEFWKEVGERAFGGWSFALARQVHELGLHVDRTRHTPALAVGTSRARRRARAYGDFYARIYRAAADASGSHTVIDSSKNVSLAYVLAAHPNVSVAVLHQVRDSRAVAHSWARHVQRPETTGRHPMMDRYNPAQSAMLWNTHNIMVEVLRPRATVLMSRYEDFVADPRSAVESIASRLKLPYSHEELGFIEGDTVQLGLTHTVAGNPMRFRQGALQLHADDRWRTEMNQPSRRLVTAMTAPLLLRYGYPVGGS